MPNRLAPSILAASSSSLGISGVVVAEDQRADRDAIDDMHEDQAGDRAVEAHDLQYPHHRDQDALVWDEHAEQHQREDEVRSRKLPLGQDVAVQRAEERRADGGRDGDQEAVDEVAVEPANTLGRVAEPCPDVAVEVQAGWQIPHPRQADLLEALHACDDQQVDGQQVDGRGRDEGDVEQHSAPTDLPTAGRLGRESVSLRGHSSASVRLV